MFQTVHLSTLLATSPAWQPQKLHEQWTHVQVSQSTPPLCGSDPLSMETWQHGSHASPRYQPSPVITIIVIMSPFAKVTVHGVPSSDDAYSQVVTTKSMLYSIILVLLTVMTNPRGEWGNGSRNPMPRTSLNSDGWAVNFTSLTGRHKAMPKAKSLSMSTYWQIQEKIHDLMNLNDICVRYMIYLRFISTYIYRIHKLSNDMYDIPDKLMNSQEICCNTPFLPSSVIPSTRSFQAWGYGQLSWNILEEDLYVLRSETWSFLVQRFCRKKLCNSPSSPVWSVFERGSEKQSWSFPLLNTWLAEWYPKVLPDATLSIACRRVGGAIINSSTPRRVLCRSNTSSSTETAKICFQKNENLPKRPSCHSLSLSDTANFSARDWAAHRRCSAHHLGLQCWSLARNHPRLKGAFRGKKGDLLTSHLRHF